MREEIAHARHLGANGIVLGLLDEQGCVDVLRTQKLVELARPLPVTFHRAIDMTPDLSAAMEDVVATGASRILTSGGAPDATRGIRQIARMVEAANGRIAIMAGGGITAEKIVAIAENTGATEFHSSPEPHSPARSASASRGWQWATFMAVNTGALRCGKRTYVPWCKCLRPCPQNGVLRVSAKQQFQYARHDKKSRMTRVPKLKY